MKPLLFALMVCLSFVAIADGYTYSDINTIQMKHRLAEDILPQIQPFLTEESTARAYRDMIILKTDPDTFFEVHALIKKLDVPLQRVKISVMRTNLTHEEIQARSTSIEVRLKDSAQGRASVQRWSTHANDAQDQYYQAQGIDGRPVTINMGRDIPQQQQVVFFGNNGNIAVSDETYYVSVQSGFQAIARVMPDMQVRVTIHPIFGQFSPVSGDIQHSQIITTISGPSNEWLELGRISNEKNIDNQGVTSYNTQRHHQQNLFLKVEPIQ
jgi:hypothetical protein